MYGLTSFRLNKQSNSFGYRVIYICSFICIYIYMFYMLFYIYLFVFDDPGIMLPSIDGL